MLSNIKSIKNVKWCWPHYHDFYNKDVLGFVLNCYTRLFYKTSVIYSISKVNEKNKSKNSF